MEEYPFPCHEEEDKTLWPDDNEITDEDTYDPDEYKDIIDDVYMDSDGHFVVS